MRPQSIAAVILGVSLAAGSCVSRDATVSDSARADTLTSDSADLQAIPADTAAVDSAALAPQTPPPAAADNRFPASPPRVIGETRREGSTLGPQDEVDRDPRPNLIGETHKAGGTLGPSAPPERDSAFEPKIMMGPTGQPIPIKR